MSIQLYSNSIEMYAEKQPKESRLDLWASRLCTKKPTWTKPHYRYISVMERPTLTLVSNLCGCEEAVLGWWKQACCGPMHLVLDVHQAQKTEEIRDLVVHLWFSLLMCPSTTYSRVQ